MTGGPNTADALPADSSATEALENAVEESRREYDKKVETIEEIDDKAMRSVRTAVISLGVVASAVGVGGPGAVGKLAILPILVGALGVGALTVAIVYGIGAYTVTQYPTGIGSTHRTDVLDGAYSENEWVARMIREYDEWSDEIAEEIAHSLRYLEVTQAALSVGVVSLLVSASAILAKTAYGIRPTITLVGVVASLLAVRTYLGKKD